jgi:hypothetical protein
MVNIYHKSREDQKVQREERESSSFLSSSIGYLASSSRVLATAQDSRFAVWRLVLAIISLYS